MILNTCNPVLQQLVCWCNDTLIEILFNEATEPVTSLFFCEPILHHNLIQHRSFLKGYVDSLEEPTTTSWLAYPVYKKNEGRSFSSADWIHTIEVGNGSGTGPLYQNVGPD